MRKLFFVVVLSFAFVTKCFAAGPSTTHAGMGAGAIVGAVIHPSNPWKGGVIGGIVGGVVGSILEQNQEAVAQRVYQPQYQPQYEQWPRERTDCEKRSNRSWNNGRQTNDSVNERCVGHRTTYDY